MESVRRFRHDTNGATYKIVINSEELSYQVVEDMSSTVVKEGRAVNMHQVKIKAKQHLINLGIKGLEEKEQRPKQRAA